MGGEQINPFVGTVTQYGHGLSETLIPGSWVVLFLSDRPFPFDPLLPGKDSPLAFLASPLSPLDGFTVCHQIIP